MKQFFYHTFTKCQSFKYSTGCLLLWSVEALQCSCTEFSSQWSTNSETDISTLFWSVNSLVPQSATFNFHSNNRVQFLINWFINKQTKKCHRWILFLFDIETVNGVTSSHWTLLISKQMYKLLDRSYLVLRLQDSRIQFYKFSLKLKERKLLDKFHSI